MSNNIKKKIEDFIRESEKTIAALHEQAGLIERAVEMITASLRRSGKVMICGNGGSAADSQHIAAELIGRFKRERRSLPAIALSTDTSILTSLANDYSYDDVFSRQVEGLGREGDVLIMISTSGNSVNVIHAGREAKKKGIATIGLLGGDGGKMEGEVDLAIIVASADTARIQEGHTLIYHIICDLVEEAFADGKEA